MTNVEAAVFFQALADSTRLRILRFLRERPHTVGELVSSLGCQQPKVSRHLKVLKDAGLVADTRSGRNVAYRATADEDWPIDAREWLDRLGALRRRSRDEASRAPARPRGRSSSRRSAPRIEPADAREREQPRPAPAAPVVRKDLDAHLL